MNVYEKKTIGERIKGNSYVGRGLSWAEAKIQETEFLPSMKTEL